MTKQFLKVTLIRFIDIMNIFTLDFVHEYTLLKPMYITVHDSS
jgi:hypothetical protein